MLANYRRRISERLRGRVEDGGDLAMELYCEYRVVVVGMIELQRVVSVKGSAVGGCMTRDFVNEWFGRQEGILRFEGMLGKLVEAVERFAGGFDEYGLDPDDGGDDGDEEEYWGDGED